MSNICSNFGAKVKQYRNSKGYSTQELAKKLNVSVGLMNNIENAKNDVFELDFLLNLINELDMDLLKVFENYTPAVTIKQIDRSNIISIELNSSTNTDTLEILKNYILEISSLFVQMSADKGYNEDFMKTLSNHIAEELKFIFEISKY